MQNKHSKFSRVRWSSDYASPIPQLSPHAFAPHEPLSSEGFHTVQCQGEAAAIYFQIRIYGSEWFHTGPKTKRNLQKNTRQGLHLELSTSSQVRRLRSSQVPQPTQASSTSYALTPISVHCCCFLPRPRLSTGIRPFLTRAYYSSYPGTPVGHITNLTKQGKSILEIV